jgi:hypothetical protein
MADATAPTGRPLGEALRALPLEAPDASAWPLLAARLARPAPRARPRRLVVFALAASVLAAVLLVRGANPDVAAPAATDPSDLAELQLESARLERLLAAAHDDVSGNASALVFSLQLEDRLQAVDAELARPGLADDRRLALWRQRVEVLHAAAGLESSRRYYAAQGEALEPTLVATY